MEKNELLEQLRRAVGSQAFCDSLPVGVYCCDAEGIIRLFNRCAAQMWGQSPDPGDTDQRFCGSYQLFTEDGSPLPHSETPMARVLQTGAGCSGESVVIQRPDGDRISVIVNIQPLFNESGDLIGAVNTFQDISATMKATLRAQESEAAYKRTLNALPAAVYVTDESGLITFFNEAAVSLAGRRPVLGTDRWCVSHRLFRIDGAFLPHDECPMAIAVKECRAVRAAEAVLERPNGERVIFEAYPTPFFNAEGALAGAVNMLIDVTQRHEAELGLARLAAIVSSSDDAIVSKTLDGVVRSWNASAERIFGYAAEEMIGQSILRIIPPDLHGEETEIISKLRRGERIEHFDTVRVRKNGERIPVSLTISPIRNAAGDIVGASKIARDISERKKAEEGRNLLIRELNHRVKNTLATVQAIARQTASNIEGGEEFSSRFAGRLSSLAAAHDHLTANDWSGADLAAIIDDQVLYDDDENLHITRSGPRVFLAPQPALHLALVLHELGTNARKHGALSSPGGRVAISWREEPPSMGDRERILILNWIESGGPRARRPERSGFGMSLIRAGLSSHGGECHVEFRDKGLSATIRLPLPAAPGAKAAASRAYEGRSGVRQAPPIGGKRVLIVEDEPLVAMEIAAIVESAGCVVLGPVATLAAAKSRIEAGGFDAVLLDANLAGAPVGELARLLEENKQPFGFVTGYGRTGAPAEFRSAPIVGKPFSETEIVQLLDTLLTAP